VPDNRITGGKIMSRKTRDVKSRGAEALRLAAQSLWRAQNYLGDCLRRWKARFGTARAITAMAHKLARMIWHMIQFNQPYDSAIWAAAEEKLKKKKLHRLAQTAATLGYKLTCAPNYLDTWFLKSRHFVMHKLCDWHPVQPRAATTHCSTNTAAP
jgi:hypothetical protein